MISKAEPWYIHAALYAVILILVFILVKVAIIDPNNVIEAENYYKHESRLRMKNIKEAEILYFKKNNRFVGNLDSLVAFVKTDPSVEKAMAGFDSLTQKSTNPFVKLSSGQFVPDSLMYTPKSHSYYSLAVDTSISVDTVVTRTGRISKIDTTKHIGSLYYLEDPDGYGTVGSLNNVALKNTASWEQ